MASPAAHFIRIVRRNGDVLTSKQVLAESAEENSSHPPVSVADAAGLAEFGCAANVGLGQRAGGGACADVAGAPPA